MSTISTTSSKKAPHPDQQYLDEDMRPTRHEDLDELMREYCQAKRTRTQMTETMNECKQRLIERVLELRTQQAIVEPYTVLFENDLVKLEVSREDRASIQVVRDPNDGN